MQTKLVRSETDKMVAGVCGGLAAYLNVDSVLVRFAFLMLVFASGIGLPLYFILMILMPSENNIMNANHSDSEMEDGIKINKEDIANLKSNDRSAGAPSQSQGPIVFAIVLILIGFYLLAQNMGILGWINVSWLGPLLIIGIGLYVIFRRRQ